MLGRFFYPAFFFGKNTMTDANTETVEFQTDNLQRFIFDNAAIRGEWVNLTHTWQHVITRRQYPVAIQSLLGEMMAAAALLAATVKMKGRLVLQIKSSGPVSLLMVECTSNNTLRAFAQWKGKIVDNASLLDMTGEGTLAITIDTEGSKKPYQGVVSLQGGSLSDMLEVYFKQSEQLETRIWLAADSHAVSGLFLQQLPKDKDDDEEQEHWSRISQLASTVTSRELLSLGAGTLLHRLFHEEECLLLNETNLSFSCNCSRERVIETISLLGQDDANKLLAEQGQIEVACEFCNEHYHFDDKAVSEVFSKVTTPDARSKTLH